MLSDKENRMEMTIIGIDASLSSTGIAIASCGFNNSNKEELFALLTQPKSSYTLSNVFKLCYTEEIKEDKDTKKEIAKVRKELRENPTLELLVKEEELSTKKIIDQVSEIMATIKTEEIQKSCPVLIFIEDYSYHSPGSLTQLAEMKGVLKYEMDAYLKTKSHNIRGYLTANINTVKKVGGRNGNSNKELMCEELKRFGFDYDIDRDDMADATAVSLAAFYTIYHMLNTFEVPKCDTAKERNYYKSFIQSLDTFAARIGSKDELLKIIK